MELSNEMIYCERDMIETIKRYDVETSLKKLPQSILKNNTRYDLTITLWGDLYRISYEGNDFFRGAETLRKATSEILIDAINKMIALLEERNKTK